MVFSDEFTPENVVKSFVNKVWYYGHFFDLYFKENKELKESKCFWKKECWVRKGLKKKELIIEKQTEQIAAAVLDAKIKTH